MIDLKRPTLILDKQKCLANIKKMKAKADLHHLDFRPHFKTHQSAEIGEWIRYEGVEKITVSSVLMADNVAYNGCNDIVIAVPVKVAASAEINRLAENIQVNVLIESFETLELLGRKVCNDVGFFVKIDAGYHRTGIPIDNHQLILKLVSAISSFKYFRFKGFLLHNGQTYAAKGIHEVIQIHNQVLQGIQILKQFIDKHQIEAMFSLGDTPAMSLADHFYGVDEIRPGNFVFYDVMQQNIGSCNFDEIAVALAVPVVAKHPSRNELVVYGGAVHLSKESTVDQAGNQIFGRVVQFGETGWGAPVAGTYVKSLSQEHGIVKTTSEMLENLRIGDFIGILPVHSCLTAHLMREYFTLQGERIATMLAGS